MKAEDAIRTMVETLAAEDVDAASLMGVESKLKTWLHEARKVRAVADMFPTKGAIATAKQLGIARSTVYKLLHRHRKLHLNGLNKVHGFSPSQTTTR